MTTGRFSDTPNGILRLTLGEINYELVRRIDAGMITAEEVRRRLGVSSIDELRQFEVDH